MMRTSSYAAIAIACIQSALSAAVPDISFFPDLPFTTSGRDIITKSGEVFTYAGVNWPGAADAMLPEGLQYQSIASTVKKIKSLGMNSIRLTYAIEMIDDIYAGNPSQSLKGTLLNALGDTNGTKVLKQILKHNPQFNENTHRLDVYDAVAAECASQGIYVHLDNHVSKAQWCCSHTDGNAWFGDTYFNVDNWRRGLRFMANHTQSWSNLASMSLRNELRSPDELPQLSATEYNWLDWYENVIPAATGINNNNKKPLIFFSGLNYDVDLSKVTIGAPLTGPNSTTGPIFNISALQFANKVVFEIHNYQNSATNCSQIIPGLYTGGYNAMNMSDTTVLNHAPVVLTEFGFNQDNSSYLLPYSQCLANYLEEVKGGFMQWVIAGSYYIRSGVQETDETWGLLKHDWSGWRAPSATKFTKSLAKAVQS